MSVVSNHAYVKQSRKEPIIMRYVRSFLITLSNDDLFRAYDNAYDKYGRYDYRTEMIADVLQDRGFDIQYDCSTEDFSEYLLCY
jgi:hypothetical protein